MVQESGTSGHPTPRSRKPLPEFGQEIINFQVNSGSQLIIIDSTVYDVRDFMSKHPGGEVVLQDFIGKDATEVFFGLAEYKENGKTKKYAHSRLAQFKLHEMAVAFVRSTAETSSKLTLNAGGLQKRNKAPSTINSSDNVNTKALSTEKHALPYLPVVKKSMELDAVSIKTNRTEKEFNELTTEDIMDFQPVKLVAKVEQTQPFAKNPVKKFSFDLPGGASIVPGDCIFIRQMVNGNEMRRAYTPIAVEVNGTLDIYIKIYRTGFTTVLDQVPIGGIVELTPPYPFQRLITQSQEGCFENLLFIAGGSGITPLLLILDHHLKNGSKNFDGSFQWKITILWVNKTEADIFDCPELDKYLQLAGSSAELHHIVQEGDENTFDGYIGSLTPAIVREIAPKINGLLTEKHSLKKPMPSQPEIAAVNAVLICGTPSMVIEVRKMLVEEMEYNDDSVVTVK
jgi:NAD(P)H-flavin reductase